MVTTHARYALSIAPHTKITYTHAGHSSYTFTSVHSPRLFFLHCNNIFSGRAGKHNEAYFKKFIDRTAYHEGLAMALYNIDIDGFNPRAYPDQTNIPPAVEKTLRRARAAQSAAPKARDEHRIAAAFSDLVRRAVLTHPKVVQAHDDDDDDGVGDGTLIGLDDLVDTVKSSVSKAGSDVQIRRDIMKVLGQDFGTKVWTLISVTSSLCFPDSELTLIPPQVTSERKTIKGSKRTYLKLPASDDVRVVLEPKLLKTDRCDSSNPVHIYNF